MNQDQIKTLLKKIEPSPVEFQVILTGKKSSKVNGLYKPETRDILLHNGNFDSDSQLLYTAIHEYAHHLHFCSNLPPQPHRAHTQSFWSIFHSLLKKAEDLKLYTPGFMDKEPLRSLTETIKKEYLVAQGEMMKRLGNLLQEAQRICAEQKIIFEDYLDRILHLDRTTAKIVMKSFNLDIPEKYGYSTMKLLSQIPNPEQREEVEKFIAEGYTPVMIKNELKKSAMDPLEATDPKDHLLRTLETEKETLVESLNRIKAKLEKVEQQIALHKQREDTIV